MIALWITLGLIAWFLLSIPVALFLARACALNNKAPRTPYDGPEVEPVYLPK